MNQRTLRNSVEINILELLWDMLMMWRPVVAVMLIFGLLTSGFMFVRTERQAQAVKEEIAKLEEQKLEKDEGDIENALKDLNDLKKELTDAEMATVERVAEQYSFANNRRDFLSKAPYYQIDLASAKTLKINVYFNIPQEDAYHIVENARIQIVESVRTYVDDKYEIAREYDYGLFNVGAVTLYRDEDTDVVAMYIAISILLDKKFNENSSTRDIEKIVANSLDGISYDIVSNATVDNDPSIIDTRYIAKRDLAYIEIDYNSTLDSFSDEQKRAFEIMTKVTMDDRFEHNSEGADVEEEERVIEIPRYGTKEIVKYWFLGCVLGIFFFAFILFLKEVIFLKIKSPEDICGVYGIRNYGEVRQYPYQKFFERFCYSKLVYDLRHKQTKEESITELKAYVEISHNDTPPVMFILGQVMSEVSAIGKISIDVLDKPRSIRAKLIEENDDIILVVESNKVSARIVDELMSSFLEQGRKPSGIIVTEG